MTPPGDGRITSCHEAFGTIEEVAADAMLLAGPWTLIRIEDEDGGVFVFLVSHWLEA